MPLNFPSNPTNGQEYTFNGITYTFGDEKWVVNSSETPIVNEVNGNMNVDGALSTTAKISLLSAGNSGSIDCSSANFFDLSLTNNTTFSFNNVPTDKEFTFKIKFGLSSSGVIDISNASFVGQPFTATGFATLNGGHIAGVNEYLILVNSNSSSSSVNLFTMSTPGDVSTATLTNSLTVGSEQTNPTGAFLEPGGTYLFVCGNSSVTQYALSTPFQLNGGEVAAGRDFTFGDTSTVTNITFNDTGTEFYVVSYGDNNIYSYTCSLPFELVGVSLNNTLNTGRVNSGIQFTNDGKTLLVLASSTGDVKQYSLSTAYDISTATDTGNTFSYSFNPRGLILNQDQTKFYMHGSSNDDLYEFSTNNSSSSVSITWPENISWASGTTPIETLLSNAEYIYEFTTLDGGTTWIGKEYYDTALPGEVIFTTPGTHTWTAPAGVTSVSVVAVGGGAGGQAYVTVSDSNISVLGAAGETSYFIDTSTVAAQGGQQNSTGGGSVLAGTGGAGGNPGVEGAYAGGGGGAGGYSGSGGTGATDQNLTAQSGSGGGGAGGQGRRVGTGANYTGASGGGGGVGLFGEGASGIPSAVQSGGGGGGSGGNDGIARDGGLYGGGGGGNNAGYRNSFGSGGALAYKNNITVVPGQTYTVVVGAGGAGAWGLDSPYFNNPPIFFRGGNGAHGAVRIVWGTNREFPSTNVDQDSSNGNISIL